MGGSLYTIKSVSKKTGIPAATLRKWEQRYGLVAPLRLENGYRGYTERDLHILKWVNQRVQTGELISTVAEEIKERLREGWHPPEAPPAAAAGVAPRRERLLAQLLASDTSGAVRSLEELFSVLAPESVLLDVFQPILYDIGERWESGKISEFQEHAASSLLRDRIAALRAFQGQADGPHIVTGCVPGELHEIGILMVGYFAMRKGCRVTHLGISPSPDGLRLAIRQLRPDAVCLSVSMDEVLQRALPHLSALVAEAARLEQPPLLFLGGRAAPPTLPGFVVVQRDGPEALAEVLQRLTR